jgi:hypothetical protein
MLMSNKEFARLDVLLGLEAKRIQVADACALLGHGDEASYMATRRHPPDITAQREG